MADKFINKADISDVLIERPIGFSIKKKHFSVYPATLGKIQLYSRLIEAIGFEIERASMKDILIKTKSNRDELLRLVAYATLPGSECLDEMKVRTRIKELSRIEDADLATIVIIAITGDKTTPIMKHFGIDLEAMRMKKVLAVKEKNKSSVSFSGKSVWGTLIDVACERYGWSFQYVVWGISYNNLQLMVADQIRTIFLTDEERKKVGIPEDNIIIRADDAEAIAEFIKRQNWR